MFSGMKIICTFTITNTEEFTITFSYILEELDIILVAQNVKFTLSRN